MGRNHQNLSLMMILLLAVLIAGFRNIRYGGWQIEGDALAIQLVAEGIVEEATLVPSGGHYPNGYNFQALLAILAIITGQEPSMMQALTTFWIVVIVIGGFLAYQHLLGDIWLALISTIILLLMPDFLFPVLRDSHERITWTFALLIIALWLSIRDRRRMSAAAAKILAIYLLYWGMITSNAFLSSTILFTFAFALLMSQIINLLKKRRETVNVRENRMVYFLVIGTALIYIFTFYAYFPARGYYLTLESVWDKVAVVLLGAEKPVTPEGVNFLTTGWRSISTYIGLVALQSTVLIISFLAWLRMGWLILRSNHEVDSVHYILWLLYFGMGLQLAFGSLADISGAIAGNLQVRLATPFLILATPMAVTWLRALKRPTFSARISLSLKYVIIVIGCIGAITALLKVTNDPVVSNFWTFYNPQEVQAGKWIDGNLSNGNIWLDVNSQKRVVLSSQNGYGWESPNVFMFNQPESVVSHFILSEITTERASLIGFSLPYLEAKNLVYDTGKVQIYHRRPQTPFQK